MRSWISSHPAVHEATSAWVSSCPLPSCSMTGLLSAFPVMEPHHTTNGGWLGLARSMRGEMESRLMLSVRAARPERRGPYAHAPQTDQLHHGGDRSVLRPLRRPVAALRGAHRTASVPDWLALAARAQQDAGRAGRHRARRRPPAPAPLSA